MTEVKYQVINLSGMPEDEKRPGIEKFEHSSADGTPKPDFWGGFLPTGELCAMDGSFTREEATIIFEAACKQHRTQ